jgi:Cu+-exporting ATPase
MSMDIENHNVEMAGGGGGTDNSEGAAKDPVCGMSVGPSTVREKGLHSRYHETDYYFCSKGCKLDFDEDPERYLDPSYVPSM